jgi:hypothetical protein
MKIGILDESVIKKIVTDIIIDRPEVINVFVEGTELIIESDDIDSLVEYLDKEHGLHLIVNGDSYMIASKINEGLAQIAAEAGARAADVASRGLVSTTKEFMDKKRKEVGEPTTDAEKDEEAKEMAQDSDEEGDAEEETIDKFRGIKAMSKEMNPETMNQKVINSREIQQMVDKDPKFVQVLKKIIAKSDDKDGGTLKDKIVDILKEE